MKQIRKNLFETNSSSCHTVSIESNGSHLEESKFKVNDDNYIEVPLNEFGWSLNKYDDQENKLAYLILIIAYTNGFGDCFLSHSDDIDKWKNKLYKCDDFEELNSDIAYYTNTNGINIINIDGGYIDHQSVERFSSLSDFLYYYGINSTIDFIFDSNISIITNNDN